MNTEFKAIFSDIDGTLLNTSHQITSKTKEAIKRVHQKGLPFVLVSARPPMAMDYFVSDLELNCPFVAFNGGLIVAAKSHEILYSVKLGEENFARVCEELTNFDENRPKISLSINYFENLNWYSSDPLGYWTSQEEIIVEVKANGKKPKNLKDAHKILVMERPEVIAELEAEIAPKFPDLTIKKSKTTYLEITNKQATKSGAIKFLETYLKFSSQEAMAFGDNFNDLDMLEYCGYGVAMNNAPQGVKDKVQEITADNNNDGIALVLNRIFNK